MSAFESMSAFEPVSVFELTSVFESMSAFELMSVFEPVSVFELTSVFEPMSVFELMSVFEPVSVFELMSVFEPEASPLQLAHNLSSKKLWEKVGFADFRTLLAALLPYPFGPDHTGLPALPPADPLEMIQEYNSTT